MIDVLPHGQKDYSCLCGQPHCAECGEVYPCSRRHKRDPALLGLAGGREHARQTGHRVVESLERPWWCRDCQQRSLFYELQVRHSER